jgi:3,4-dihydroxy 2-butanone 4-phosphate synthase/GTP cyclohydrolase II
VQPGHIFPLRAEPGGVLIRAGQTEAAVDYTRIAGLTPAAVIADVLDASGALADAQGLADFAAEHKLKLGTIADLIHYRMANERTIERLREGIVTTRFGEFRLTAYRDRTHGGVHIALARGDIDAQRPTLVRVHVASTLRDVLGTQLDGVVDGSVDRCLAQIAAEGAGVLVLLRRSESDEQLLESIDFATGKRTLRAHSAHETYNTIGLGSQILRDLGVGRIRLMGAPIKYNAISGFGLEVSEYLRTDRAGSDGTDDHD